MRPAYDRELLLKVYGAALDEYRFNVNLSWDRTKFFLLLNSGMIAAGVGLFRIAQGGDWLLWLFLIGFFFVVIAVSTFGLETIAMGKEYYREAVFTKTLIERELGLLDPLEPPLADGRVRNLSIAVTRGMRDSASVLGTKQSGTTVVRWRSITGQSRGIFWAMISIEVLACVACAISMAKSFG